MNKKHYPTYFAWNVKHTYSLTNKKLGQILGVPESTISMWCIKENNWTTNKKAFDKLYFLWNHDWMPTSISLFLVRFV